MTALTIIQTICPALALDANVANYLTIATNYTNADFFCNNYEMAIAYRACHIYTLSKRSLGAGGNIASLGEGGLSISYSGMGAGGDDLSQTSYGLMLKDLMRCAISVTNKASLSYLGVEGCL